MAKIGFIIDTEPGHLYPTIGFAEDLLEAGNEVCFLGIHDMKSMVKNPDISYKVIFESVYPEGFFQQFIQLKQEKKELFLQGNKVPRPHIASILEGEVSKLITQQGFDLLILNFSLPIEALLIKKMNPSLKLAFLIAHLRPIEFTPQKLAKQVFQSLEVELQTEVLQKLKGGTLQEALGVLDGIPEINLCPKAFGIQKHRKYSTPVLHHNASLRVGFSKTDFFDTIKEVTNKKIIYLSLGSQTALFREASKQLFSLFYELMQSSLNSNWLGIMSVGNTLKSNDFKSIPGKIKVVSWAPQLEILSRASLMITHSGMGTIKECIHFKVPMLAVPMIYDQPSNAKRIEYHELGKVLAPEKMTIEKLHTQITEILNSSSIQSNVEQMHHHFKKSTSFPIQEWVYDKLPLV